MVPGTQWIVWIALLTPLLIMTFALVMESVEAPFARQNADTAGRLPAAPTMRTEGWTMRGQTRRQTAVGSRHHRSHHPGTAGPTTDRLSASNRVEPRAGATRGPGAAPMRSRP